MAPNYARLALTAQRLIEGAGASVTVVRQSRALVDADAPHRGYTPSEATYSVIAVEKDYKESSIDGESIKVGDKKLVIAALSVSQAVGSFTPKRADTIRISSKDWQVVVVTEKKPGDTVISYELQVRSG